MRTSSIVWIIVLIIVIGGGWYLLDNERSQSAPEGAQGPSQAMGINGSPNQGNMGATSTGTVQQPDSAGLFTALRDGTLESWLTAHPEYA